MVRLLILIHHQKTNNIHSAATCLAPLKEAGCKIDGTNYPNHPKSILTIPGLIPKGAMGAGGMPGKPPGGLARPAGGASPAAGGMAGMNMVRRQDSPPKISPEQIAAAKSARDCFCAAPAMKSAQTCITSSCASAADGGAGAVKGINAICKGVVSHTSLHILNFNPN